MPARTVVRYIRKSNSGRTTYKQRERIVQRALTKYLNSIDVIFFNDYASGAYLTYGQNQQRVALACKHGWLDLLIAEPRNGFAGLFLELKREGETVYRRDGKLRKNDQLYKEFQTIQKLRDRGYKAEFAIGLDQAKKLINEYLGLPVLEQEELF